jgi:hypothetical protein
MRRVGFPEVLDELAHSLTGKTVKRFLFEGVRFSEDKEAEEAAPAHPVLVQCGAAILSATAALVGSLVGGVSTFAAY